MTQPQKSSGTDSDTDVIVVGCGPTGATAAIMLAQRGLQVLVLDRWAEPYPLPRAVHFDDEVFRIFADLGLADQIHAISRPASGMQLVDVHLRLLANFERKAQGGNYGFPQANMFDQPNLERVLRDRMAQMPGITIVTRADVTGLTHPTRRHAGAPGPTTVHYRDLTTGAERSVAAAAVLGCDGANSAMRSLIGATLDSLGFEQQWMVIDVTSPQTLNVYDGVQQVCDHDRAATFMMVTPGRYRWEFRLQPGEKPEELDDRAVITRIRPWLGAADPATLTIVRRAWYTFRGAVADHWAHQRVFLLGDAAHLTPPFIGQGMCAGIRDAANLTWKLALVLDGCADDRLLATYETERRPYAQRLTKLAMTIGWVMTGGSVRTTRCRHALLRCLARLPGAEEKVANVALPTFPAGPLSDGHPAAGRLLPQPSVEHHGTRMPLDRALGVGFALVTRGPARLDIYEPELQAWFEALGTQVVEIEAGNNDEPLRHLFTATQADALLVRPDRVVAAAGTHPELRRWRAALRAAGILPNQRDLDTAPARTGGLRTATLTNKINKRSVLTRS